MSYIGNQPSNVAFLTDTFNGTGSQTAFTMSVAPASTTSVLVAVTGVLQDPSTYSVSGTTLTFSAAPPSGTGNISVRYMGIPASGVTTTAYRTLTEFTATAGQTTFTPPSYTVGYINVYRNGALLGTADYTATNGTTVVLGVGATVGDLIAVESFYVSSVLNAIPQSGGTFSGAVAFNAGITNDVTTTTGGVYAKSTFAGTVPYTDGIVMDYTTGTGRITVGSSDGFQLRNGGPSSPTTLLSQGVSGYTLALQGATPVAGAGLSFPATQVASSDANTLDDYEEGTFTPTFTGTGTFVYGRQVGRYTKIGNVVSIQVDIYLNSQSGGSGALGIGGMPFTIATLSPSGAPSIMIFGDNNWTTPRSNLCGYYASSTAWNVTYNSGNNIASVNVTDIGQSGRLLITGTYQTS